MTMAATEQRSDTRTSKQLRKQSEIEETEEQESSPGSDQSDATITADRECTQTQSQGGGGGGTQEGNKCSTEGEDVPTTYNHSTQVHPKIKQLTRGIAIEDMSPPPDHHLITHSTSLDSGTNGLCYKSPKAILEKSGSLSSEAGTSSSLSRDSSIDKAYKDSTGINLEDFIRKTMNKTQKDRNMLLKLETDLTNFINEPKHHFLRFPQMSSYDRMLVHRIAAFFGLDHNVDQTGKCVIVNKTSNTRIPEFCFREHIDSSEPKKKITGIMRRIGISSLDDAESDSKCLEKPLLLTAKARSFEERLNNYEKTRSKIFSDEQMEDELAVTRIISKKPHRPCSLTKSNNEGQPWSSTDSSGYGTDSSVSKTRGGSVQKAKSFGGTVSYTANHQGLKFPNKSHSLSVDPSISPSHSGINSPMGHRHQLPAATTPPGSHSDSSPLSRSSSSGPVQSPGFLGNQANQVYWVASDIRTIPPGSMIINPSTGQPLSNPDGSVYHHQPGQPPPAASPSVYPTPQYGSEVWPSGSESTATAELCRHLSMVNMGQHSIEVGEPPGGPQGAPQVQGGTPYVVQGAQQQMQTPIQQSPVVQTQFFPGQQNLSGGVHYMYPVNYGVQGRTPSAVQGQGHGTMIAIDNQTFSQNSNQYPPQGSYQGYPGGVAGSAATAPNVEQYQTSTNVSQSTYPVIPQGEGGVQHFTSYPIQYSSNSNYPTPQSQTTVFYSSVPTSAAQPMTGAGYSFGVGQHNPYHSVTPPSQGSATLTNQTVALHNLGQGQPMSIGPGGVTTPTAGAPGGNQQQTPTNAQFMYSTVPQFTGQPRAANPQLVQYHNVPGAQTASTPTQAVPLLRNMQLNMQVPAQVTALQQQHLQGGLTITQPGPLSVGAKGCYQMENQMSKLETAGDSKDYMFGGMTALGSNMVAGPPRPAAPIIRPPAPITQEVRLLGQTSYRQPLQVPFPAQVIPQQPQKMRTTGGLTAASTKPQRLKKSRSRDSTDSSAQSQDSTEAQSGPVLEVCDLPSSLKRSEAETWLKDLVNVGAKVQFIPQDSSQTDHPHQTISSFRKILAIFPSVAAATKALHSQENVPYKLRLSTSPVAIETIGVNS